MLKPKIFRRRSRCPLDLAGALPLAGALKRTPGPAAVRRSAQASLAQLSWIVNIISCPGSCRTNTKPVPTGLDPFIWPIGSIFAQKVEQNLGYFSKNFLKFEPSLSQIWDILKNRPIHIPNFAFYKAHSYTKRLILLPTCWCHESRRVFCTATPGFI